MITGKTKLVGIFGDPVAHTLSPPMHNAAFDYLGLDYAYIPFRVKREHLKVAIDGVKALHIQGFNVTIPHKTTILDYLDQVDETANLIGAVNTVKIQDGETIGFNTDGLGALKAIQEKTTLNHKKVVILGAGGAARAVSFQLLKSHDVELVILNRTPKRAIQLKNDLERNFKSKVLAGGWELMETEIKGADIIIHTTPRGMHPHEDEKPLLRAKDMHSQLLVNDLVYNPLQTGLLKEAELAGARTISGLKMLLYQGAEAFKIWTGREAPLQIMEKSLKKLL